MCDLYSCVLVIAPIRVFYLLSLSWVRFWPGQTVWRWTSLFRRCSEACSSTPDATWDEKHTHLFNTVNCPNSCQQILAADSLLKIRRQQFNSKDANLSLERFFWDIFPGTICCQYVFWVIVQGVISCAYVTTLIQHNMRIFFNSCSDGTLQPCLGICVAIQMYLPCKPPCVDRAFQTRGEAGFFWAESPHQDVLFSP